MVKCRDDDELEQKKDGEGQRMSKARGKNRNYGGLSCSGLLEKKRYITLATKTAPSVVGKSRKILTMSSTPIPMRMNGSVCTKDVKGTPATVRIYE